MFFTQEDYIKIQDWLVRNSIKDTEFNEAYTPFNGNEVITIVQEGKNKKVLLNDLVSQIFELGVSDFVNITDKYNAPNITLEEAIKLIPSRARKEGQVITFSDKDNHWHIYQFKGVLNQWNILDQWGDVFSESTITANILPDEEDLTASFVSGSGTSYLLLKDREYNPEDFSGLGRVILRKNIVELEDPLYGKVKKNILTQDMVNQENTIYEIRYDFDLNSKEVTIPEGCVLKFEGGSLSNGKLIGQNTTITAGLVKIFNTDVKLDGKWRVKSAFPEWVGGNALDYTEYLNYFSENKISEEIVLSSQYYVTNTVYFDNINVIGQTECEIYTDKSIEYLVLYNNRTHIDTFEELPIKRYIQNVTFDGRGAAKKLLGGGTCEFLQIKNCRFNNAAEIGLEASANNDSGNVKVEDCYFLCLPKYQLQSNTAIKANRSDSIYRNCVIRDYVTGITASQSSLFSYIHYWVFNSSIIQHSTFADVYYSFVNFDNCVIDTCRYAFKFKYNASSSYTYVTNCQIIVNRNIYTEELGAAYPMKIFSGYPKNLYVNNMMAVVGRVKTCIIDNPFVSNKFLNCKWFDDSNGTFFIDRYKNPSGEEGYIPQEQIEDNFETKKSIYYYSEQGLDHLITNGYYLIENGASYSNSLPDELKTATNLGFTVENHKHIIEQKVFSPDTTSFYRRVAYYYNSSSFAWGAWAKYEGVK